MNNAEQKSHQSGSISVSPEFSQAQKPSQVFVRTHPKDSSLMVTDGYKWKKYGQKKVTRDNPSPRAYFKCSMAPTCPVKKKVQRSIQDRSILVATYEGKHNHGGFRDLLELYSSSTPEGSTANNLPMTIESIERDAANIDLALCNLAQRETRLGEDVKKQNDRGSRIKFGDYASCMIKDPDFIIPLAQEIVHSINCQSKQVNLNLNLGLPESHL